jgi:cell division control protein 6
VPYNANQLQQILRRRAAKAFQETELIPVDETDGTHEGDTVAADTGQQYVFRSEVLDSDVIPLISAFAAQDKGDARQAIRYLRKAGEIADKNGAEMVTEQTVREAQS